MRFSRPLTCLVMLSLAAIQTAAAAGSDATRLFEQLDTNQDDVLGAEEIAPSRSRLFARLLRTADADADGLLSIEEFRRGLHPRRPEKPLAEKYGSDLPSADALLLLLAKMDANGDRTIELDEVPRRFRDFFTRAEERLGGEPDGRLDGRELIRQAPQLSRLAQREVDRLRLDVELELALLPEKKWKLVQAMRSPPRRGEMLADRQQALALFRRLDADGDGQVVLEEVPPALAERFDQLMSRADRDGNDQLSQAELLALSAKIKAIESNRLPQEEIDRGVERLLHQFDRNDDGQLSREELPRRLTRRFERVDADGNGSLDRDEMSRVVEVLTRLRTAEGDAPGDAMSTMIPDVD